MPRRTMDRLKFNAGILCNARKRIRRARRPITMRSAIAITGLRLIVVGDFAQLIKVYAAPREGEQRYSLAEVVDAVPVVISGNPDPKKICIWYVERQNLTMRMQLRHH